MASLRRALPSLARCERPRKACSRFCTDQPGRLAQGPEEKKGLTGRLAGLVVELIALPLQIECPSVGRGGPWRGCWKICGKSRTRAPVRPTAAAEQRRAAGHARVSCCEPPPLRRGALFALRRAGCGPAGRRL